MALATTTLSSAVTADAKEVVLASATSIATGRLIRVNQEMMQVTQSWTSGTTIRVLRGRGGTAGVAHVTTSQAVHGDAGDFDNPPAQNVTSYGVNRPVVITSVAATSTLTHAPAGSDHRVILLGSSVITLTVPIPTADMDGDKLCILANDGAPAHLLTFTGGVAGAGGSYDIITTNGTAPMACEFVACNVLWLSVCGAAISGTTTNIAGAIA